MNHDPKQSARSCGCDPGARYSCLEHAFSRNQIDVRESEPEYVINTTGLAPSPVGLGGAPTRISTLPTDPKERKQYPLASGCWDYFPDALAAVAHVSWLGNNQHNPGKPLHWDRSKSDDEADTAMRHFGERGKRDTDGARHTAKFAWRALAILQKEIEEEEK